MLASSLAWFSALAGFPDAQAFAFTKGTYSSKTLQASAFSSPAVTVSTDSTREATRESTSTTANVLFQDLSLSMEEFNTNIPVACWWPQSTGNTDESLQTPTLLSASYAHRISVQRIGQLLAQWNFIPSFASRNFELQPSLEKRVYKANLEFWKGPVVVLAHGYLGSRFDLSHLAERLAQEGFLCLAPEYPESLAASYERLPGLDRSMINNKLLDQLKEEWKIEAKSFGIVGHSLGTGTALNTGDETWARVCLAGFPRQRDGSSIAGNLLLICSMNDGAVSLQRFGGKSVIPADYALLSEESLGDANMLLPSRSALVLESSSAPNHISFLSAGVNDAMIDLLSPLLPVAQWANIPVLDFDKYQTSRDAVPTAALLHPIIIRYLKQEMKVA